MKLNRIHENVLDLTEITGQKNGILRRSLWWKGCGQIGKMANALHEAINVRLTDKIPGIEAEGNILLADLLVAKACREWIPNISQGEVTHAIDTAVNETIKMAERENAIVSHVFDILNSPDVEETKRLFQPVAGQKPQEIRGYSELTDAVSVRLQGQVKLGVFLKVALAQRDSRLLTELIKTNPRLKMKDIKAAIDGAVTKVMDYTEGQYIASPAPDGGHSRG